MSEPLSGPQKEKIVPQAEEPEAPGGPTIADVESEAEATVATPSSEAEATVVTPSSAPEATVVTPSSAPEATLESGDEQDGPASWKDESELGARGTAELKTALKSSVPPPVQDADPAEPKNPDLPTPERWSIPPRVHNALVNAVAAVWMVVAVPLEDDTVVSLVALWVLHFGRRTVEALFVHRYSGRRVGPSDYISECVYFWGFSNWIAYGLRSPDWEPQEGVLWLVGMGLFFLGEFGNATAHLKLRSLRERSGETQRGIPRGGMFELVSSPHYLFEILTWTGFAILAQVWGAYGFLALGTILLVSSYALPRHRQYKTEFDGRHGRPRYPENRKAIFPFVL